VDVTTAVRSFSFKKGLDLPVQGAPSGDIVKGPEVRSVAVLGGDYVGLKPRLSVAEGDMVAVGTPIFAHKDTPDVMVTAPAAGRVKAINRGARRMLISVEIQVMVGGEPPVDFSNVGDAGTLLRKVCVKS